MQDSYSTGGYANTGLAAKNAARNRRIEIFIFLESMSIHATMVFSLVRLLRDINSRIPVNVSVAAIFLTICLLGEAHNFSP